MFTEDGDWITPLDVHSFLEGWAKVYVDNPNETILTFEGQKNLSREDIVEIFYLMEEYPKAGLLDLEINFINPEGKTLSGIGIDKEVEAWIQGAATAALICKNYRGDEDFKKEVMISLEDFKEKIEQFCELEDYKDFLEDQPFYHKVGDVEAFFCFCIFGKLLDPADEFCNDSDWLTYDEYWL